MKNYYQALLDAISGFFHMTPAAISFSRRQRHSMRWLMLDTKP
ncbi:MAG: hypothetical protein PF495_09865 [Spirochaetales bacterium]|nr:hypothetical protein [Spirochaetales bacterium]